jgi:hypothetical protein
MTAIRYHWALWSALSISFVPSWQLSALQSPQYFFSSLHNYDNKIIFAWHFS